MPNETNNNTTTETVDSFLADVLRSVETPDNLLASATALIAAPSGSGSDKSAPEKAPAQTPAEAKAEADAEAARKRAQELLELLGLLLCNLEYARRDQGDGDAVAQSSDRQVYRVDKQTFAALLERVNELIALQLNEVFHQPALRDFEGTWRSIADLVESTDFSRNIGISLLDASKAEISDDMATNGADIAASALFKKVYTAEYDQLGGEPYAAIIGLYEFEDSYDDRELLKGMALLCKESHAPFIAAAAPSVFRRKAMSELMEVRDVSAVLGDPWKKLREKEEFAYVGLTLPRYIVRRPYNADDPEGGVVRFEEQPPEDKEAQQYVWASSAMLFARNLVRSFKDSRWCQYIRGVNSGGNVEGLARVALEGSDDELAPPLEVVIPDYGELALASAGFIPLVHKKGTTDAVFFSSQSMKLPQDGSGADPHISENSQLTCNLAYTFSISRLAHYLKRMMRNNVGSSADANYVRSQIDTWISRYVTTIVNPDDLTLRHYPFKAYTLFVTPVDGRAGWYDCNLTVQPHIQFEGMNVTLRVDARLDARAA